MNREDIIRMAREAGIDAEKDTLCRFEGWVEPFERFAALVLANNPPQSSMAWQEGYVAGAVAARADENEACAKVVEQTKWSNWFQSDCAAAIRARSKREL